MIATIGERTAPGAVRVAADSASVALAPVDAALASSTGRSTVSRSRRSPRWHSGARANGRVARGRASIASTPRWLQGLVR